VEAHYVCLPFDDKVGPMDSYGMSGTYISLLRHRDTVDSPSRAAFIKHFIGQVNRCMEERGHRPFRTVWSALHDMASTQERSRYEIGFTAEDTALIRQQCGDDWDARMSFFDYDGFTFEGAQPLPIPICIRAVCGHTKGPPSDDEAIDNRFSNRQAQKLAWSRVTVAHPGHPLAPSCVFYGLHFF